MLVFHPIVHLTLFNQVLTQLRIAVRSVSAPPFEDQFTEIMKPIGAHAVTSLVLLDSAENLPIEQLRREYHSLRRFLLLPILQDLLVLPRVVEDIEPEFNRVARPTIVFKPELCEILPLPSVLLLFAPVYWGRKGHTGWPSEAARAGCKGGTCQHTGG